MLRLVTIKKATGISSTLHLNTLYSNISSLKICTTGTNVYESDHQVRIWIISITEMTEVIKQKSI
jgi:hypothetical protein